MIQALIRSSRFNGKYVAMKDFGDNKVVGKGTTPQEAYEEALKKGYKNPVITFIPTKNMAQIY